MITYCILLLLTVVVVVVVVAAVVPVVVVDVVVVLLLPQLLFWCCCRCCCCPCCRIASWSSGSEGGFIKRIGGWINNEHDSAAKARGAHRLGGSASVLRHFRSRSQVFQSRNPSNSCSPISRAGNRVFHRHNALLYGQPISPPRSDYQRHAVVVLPVEKWKYRRRGRRMMIGDWEEVSLIKTAIRMRQIQDGASWLLTESFSS